MREMSSSCGGKIKEANDEQETEEHVQKIPYCRSDGPVLGLPVDGK